MKRFLINKTSAIGDVIQTLPVAAYLKERFPDAQIDWIAEKNVASLLRAAPLINKVIEVDTKAWRKRLFSQATWASLRKTKRSLNSIEYDAVFDLQGNAKSALWTLWARSRHKVGYTFRECPEKLNSLVANCRIPAEKGSVYLRYLSLVQGFFNDTERYDFEGIELQIPIEEDRLVEAFFVKEGLEGRSVALIAPFSQWKNKELRDGALAEGLGSIEKKEELSFVIAVSRPEEKARALEMQRICPSLHIIDSTSLTLWLAVMKKCRVVLSVDSAGLHLAALLGIPTFSLFGPSNQVFYKPLGRNHLSIQGKCPYGITFATRCPNLRTCPTGACLKELETPLWVSDFLRFYKRVKS